MQAMPFETPLYARVDLIRDEKGEPVVLELEMIEPCLFFPFAGGSAERFAAAVVRRRHQTLNLQFRMALAPAAPTRLHGRVGQSFR